MTNETTNLERYEQALRGLSRFCGSKINEGFCNNFASGYEDCEDCCVEETRQLIRQQIEIENQNTKGIEK